MNQVEFGERLQTFRKSLTPKVTQAALGDALGIGRNALANIENGRLEDVPQAAIRLLYHLYPELNPVWLETGDGPMTIDVTPSTLEELVDEKLPSASIVTRAIIKLMLTRPE